MKPHGTAGFGAAMGLLVLLAGCSSGNETADAADATDADSPLAEYLPEGSGMGMTMAFTVAGGGGEEGEKIQKLVATCMQEQGFDYTPVSGPDQPMVQFDVDNREWVAQYGYGITTADAMAPEPPDDPNAAKLEAMSPAERKAWDKALVGSANGGMAVVAGPGGGAVDEGEQPGAPGSAGGATSGADGTSGTATTSGDDGTSGAATTSGDDGTAEAAGPEGAAGADREPQGCLPKAIQQVHGDRGQIDEAEFSGLFDDLAALHQRVNTDPRVLEVTGVWSDCLADAGYPGYAKINEPQDSIMEKWSELNGWEFESSGEGAISVRAGEMGEQPTPPDATKTAELKKQEIALALADHDCRGDYQKVHDQVRIELEKQFVADHLDELERYRDVVNGAG